jgi:collagenase-like PrtC family protease
MCGRIFFTDAAFSNQTCTLYVHRMLDSSFPDMHLLLLPRCACKSSMCLLFLQACRLPYGLLVDGILKELGDVKYLLSPQDLMAVQMVPALMQAGVACFKIEGRLKGPEYVALTTRAYRQAVDTVWAAWMQDLEHRGAPTDVQESTGHVARAFWRHSTESAAQFRPMLGNPFF